MRKALVVGINDYPTAPLNECVNDASKVAELLETNGNASPNFDVRIEKNVQTKSELKKMIVELFSGSNTVALLYFSGHGYINELGGYLVTPDHKEYDEGISMDEILKLANNSNDKDKIIIFDCCHSGAFGSPSIAQGSAYLKEGISILTSSKSSEPSVEIEGEGSLFTNLLLGALNGGAADLRGHISPGGIYAYIDQALSSWKQRPVFKTNVTRFTSLREVEPQVPTDVLRKVIDYFPTPTQEYSLDPSYEDTNTDIQPYAKKENIAIFKNLQKLQSVGLVVPVDSPYMYFAAMESKSCKLTSLGHHYWRLAKNKRI